MAKINKKLDYVTSSVQWDGFKKDAKTAVEINKNLEIVHKQLDNVRTSVENFDLYHLVGVINNIVDFSLKFATLQPYEGLAMNCSGQAGNYFVRQGDIIMKGPQNELMHIKGANPGIIYPDKVEVDNGQLIMNFAYIDSFAEWKNKIKEQKGWTVKNDTISYNTAFVAGETHDVYNISRFYTQPIIFSVIDGSDGYPIVPVVKFFTPDHEPFYIDYILDDNGDQYTLVVENCPDNIIVEVK